MTLRKRRKRGQPAHGARVPDLPKGLDQWNAEFLAECQHCDSDISPAIRWLESGSRPTWTEV